MPARRKLDKKSAAPSSGSASPSPAPAGKGAGSKKQSGAGSSAASSVITTSFIYSLALSVHVYFVLWKGKLLHDPARSMTESLPVLIGIQVLYCVVGRTDEQQLGRGRVSASNARSFGSRLSTATLCAVLSLIMSVLVFGLLILFGAPLSDAWLTFLCAVHISVLSVLPLVYVYNLDSATWKHIVSAKLAVNGVYGASVGVWLGAWLGALPIPLDWDRPWQRWPITILLGAYIGAVCGTLVGTTYRGLKQRAE